MQTRTGKKRVIIDHVSPQLDGGRYPVKRIAGEAIKIQADVFGDGHDVVKASLLFRKQGDTQWQEIPMKFVLNDRWTATFIPESVGRYEYTIKGWIDHFLTWQQGFQKKHEAQQDMSLEMLIGAEFLNKAAKNTSGKAAETLQNLAQVLKKHEENPAEALATALKPELPELYAQAVGTPNEGLYEKILVLDVEFKKALFSTWYELFPRSTSETPGEHGTFKDCEKLIPRLVEMGFDVLYLPPIHPIGKAYRKGKNNSLTPLPDEPGSCWAIGAADGGHKAIHAELGTMREFEHFVKTAKDVGIDIALDFAIQCSPDHPYVKEHPQWFKWRPDGTVQYAENPPKKYQDVLPINFETDDWENLWVELKSIIEFWIDKGVTIFRVDNPHTKAFGFWEWMIAEVRKKNPNLIFLSEAFTRPRIMEHLAKIGFTQSYTYFTWRNTQQEIIQYLTELSKTEMREYFRPNFWPNTPDILPPVLQTGGEPAHIIRIILAGTMSSNYGIYGPVYEYGIATPVVAGKEEYLDSEKYEIKNWDWTKQTKIRYVITRLNQIRKENAALQTTWNITFAETDNNQFICFVKTDDDKKNKILVVVSLDASYQQSGWVKLPLVELGINPEKPYHLHDLMTDSRYTWHHEWNYVELRPEKIPAHIFRIDQ
ncbi:MAG: alpha-1,4-glucan--maltose-1-phosphate maltosyltransferase [Verrucomicrobia bacterium]|nr:alpha-1,4-glucan--maltose-1-phosphate maltosyltransferase [Cytophagales bacterium]